MGEKSLAMLDRIFEMVTFLNKELKKYEAMEYASYAEIKEYEKLKIKYETIKEIMGVKVNA